jgi:hypothetical protein
MDIESPPGRISASSAGDEPSKAGIFFQMAATILAVPALAWGVFMVWSTTFPPPCGESRDLLSLGVAENWLVGLPVGLFALITGLLVKKGSPPLRRICIVTGVIVLCLPMTASTILHRLHCP